MSRTTLNFASDRRDPSAPVSDAEILQALEKVTRSRAFSGSPKLAQFLSFVVEAAVAGNTADLRETSIGVRLFQRPQDYDPKIDSIVRTQARRVRAKLDAYYASEGADDDIVIRLEKGSYIPEFVRPRGTHAIPEREAQTGEPSPSPSPNRGFGQLTKWGAAALLAVAAVAAAVSASRMWPGTSAASPWELRVAVLPFEEEDGSGASPVPGALADSITAALTPVEGLRVMSPPDRSTTSGLEPSKLDYLVSGRFRNDQERSRISVVLTRMSDQSVTWTQVFSFPWSRLSAAKQDVAKAIAERLSVVVAQTRPGPRLRSPGSPDSFREYLNGYNAAIMAKQGLRPESFAAADRHLLKSLESDPGYPDALAMLASLQLFRALQQTEALEQWASLAESNAKSALLRAPQHGQATAVLARCALLRRDTAKAMELAQSAVRAEPNNTEALVALAEVYESIGFWESALLLYKKCTGASFTAKEPLLFGSFVAARLGRFEEAEELIRIQEATDTRSPYIWFSIGNLQMRRRQYGKAEAEFRQVGQFLISRPAGDDYRNSKYSYSRLALALAQAAQGKRGKDCDSCDWPPRPTVQRMDYDILLRAVHGNSQATLTAIEVNPYFSNYRFLSTEPLLQPLWNDAAFRAYLQAAHRRWLSALTQYGEGAPAAPPALPGPGELGVATSRAVP